MPSQLETLFHSLGHDVHLWSESHNPMSLLYFMWDCNEAIANMTIKGLQVLPRIFKSRRIFGFCHSESRHSESRGPQLSISLLSPQRSWLIKVAYVHDEEPNLQMLYLRCLSMHRVINPSPLFCLAIYNTNLERSVLCTKLPTAFFTSCNATQKIGSNCE